MNRYAIVEGYYWWFVDHHSGQNSREYQRLSKMSGYFRPGMASSEPEDYEARDIYNGLCNKAKCSHERLGTV